MTSLQYKQTLFQMLRRLFSRQKDEAYENALVYEVGSLLTSPDVVMTEENYNEFVAFFDKQVEYCYNRNIDTCYDYYQDPNFENNFNEWKELMAKINVIVEQTGTGSVEITMPDGTIKKLSSDYFNYNIDTKQGTTYNYAKLSHPYRYKYKLDESYPELSENDYKVLGGNCRWSYDNSTRTASIFGKGTVCDYITNYFNLIGLNYPWTIIFNADIIKLGKYVNYGMANMNIVSFASENQIISVPENFISRGSENNEKKVTIYTDNKILKNYNYPTDNYTFVVVKSLSEWDS